MLLLPHGTNSQAAFVLSRILIGGAMALCLILLASGIYQIIATGWRDRSLGMDLELVCKLAYICTACLGLLAYSSLLKVCQAAKLWLCQAASLLCLAASVLQGLRHGFQLTRISVWTTAVALLLAMVNSIALCLLHSERRFPQPRSQPHHFSPAPPAQQQQQQQRLYLHSGGFFQERPLPPAANDFAARFDGQQILRVPQISHMPTTVLLPPPLPPPYAAAATLDATTVKPPEYSQIYP